MRSKHLSSIDANLLVALDVLLEERSVSRAARRLGRSQPATSRILARLREALDDPLLVRQGRGMVPSPWARVIHGPLHRALADLSAALDPPEAFDVQRSDRVFRLCTSDFAQIAALGPLRAHLDELGSAVRFEVVPEVGDPSRLLEDGAIDLVVGVRELERPWIASEPIQRTGWCCVVAPGKALPESPRAFAAAAHLVVGRAGSDTFVDRALADLGLERRVVMWVPDFAGALFTAATSDLVLTLPDALAQAAETHCRLRVGPHPLSLPGTTIRVSWHVRHAKDPGILWLRAAVRAQTGHHAATRSRPC